MCGGIGSAYGSRLISLFWRNDISTVQTSGPTSTRVTSTNIIVAMVARPIRPAVILELQHVASLQDPLKEDGEAENDDEPDDGDRRRIAEVERLPLKGAFVHVGRDRLGVVNRTALGRRPDRSEGLHLTHEGQHGQVH